MDIQEIRRLNLQYLIDTKFNGVVATFARKVDKDSSYISRCLYPPEKKHSKKMGEKVAAEFCEALSFPRTWMDTPHWDKINEQPRENQIAALMPLASPPTLAALKRIEKACLEGRLIEDDMVLLDAIAKRFTNDTSSKDS
jgi:hypothetical protein